MINTNKLLNIVETIKSKYKDELGKYTYVGPDDRNNLRKGDTVKYININNINKIKIGFVVSLTLDKITFRSLNSNMYWKINYVDNHIFFYRTESKMKKLLRDLTNNKIE